MPDRVMTDFCESRYLEGRKYIRVVDRIIECKTGRVLLDLSRRSRRTFCLACGKEEWGDLFYCCDLE